MEYLSTEAKNRFGEVLSRAFEEGPQTIKRHGRKAILISEEDFAAIKAKVQTPAKPREQIDPLLNGPDMSDDTSALLKRETVGERPGPEFF